MAEPIQAIDLGGHGVWHAAYPTVEAPAVFFGPDTYRYAAALTAYVRDAPWISAAANARTHPRAKTIVSAINPAALRLARINASLAGLQQVAARRACAAIAACWAEADDRAGGLSQRFKL